MKRWTWLAAVAFGLCAGAAAGAGPTAREIEEQLLPALLVGDISRIRMSGLATRGDKAHVSDLSMADENAWEPGCYEVRFRVYCEATDDLYAKVPAFKFGNLSVHVPEDADDVFLLVGRTGTEVSIQYRFETERKGGQWVFLKDPYAGKFEWPGGVDWPVRTRGCWEEWGRQMGKRVEFFDSERDVKRELESRHGNR